MLTDSLMVLQNAIFLINRAWIPKRNIWDLDEKPPAKKRSKALSQAEDELKVYLRLLAKNKSSAKVYSSRIHSFFKR